MTKRKMDIKELKKAASKGKKLREINVKYETVLSYFKQKDTKNMQIFHVTFLPLILDFLNEIAAAQLVFKVEAGMRDPLKSIVVGPSLLKLDGFDLKGLSNEYPVQQICECLYLAKDEKTGQKALQINRSKLMLFFKNLRLIYPDFCYCVGEKYILDANDLKCLYELFKNQWMKNEEKGRLNETERLQRKICRSLYFIGIIIENNIFAAIDESQRKKNQEQAEFGTKSEHKKNIKGINQPVSSTYSFGSIELVSNFSTKLKSQKSNEEDFNERKALLEYSQKSQKIVSRTRHNLWDKVQLNNLKFKVTPEEDFSGFQFQKYEINLLSNDVENILIENAFKIQKFKDFRQRNEMLAMTSQQYCYVNYGYPYSNSYQNYHNPAQFSMLNLSPMQQTSNDSVTLMHLKRSLGCLNMVEIRKNNSRYE